MKTRGTKGLKHRLPGYVGTGLLILATSLWTFWGVGEMYYEGWWGAWSNRLPYLIPALVCLALTVSVLTWPCVGGWLIIAVGGVFTAWWFWRTAVTTGLTVGKILGMLPASGLLVAIGILFLFEGRYRQRLPTEDTKQSKVWFRRNIRYLLATGLPLLLTVAISIYWLPIVLTRVDDGNRGVRLIEGNRVVPVWAPEGPGWSAGVGSSQEVGYLLPNANLSWNDIAFYGVPPVGFGEKPICKGRNATLQDMCATGLCCYLSKDGLTVMDEPQYIWRMPTVDEIVRSLVRHGENAGCTWDGKSSHADCQILPDKETPLWVPDWSPIYYWATEEFSESQAYYVAYNGSIVGHQPKSWGNSRHGYRFVQEP